MLAAVVAHLRHGKRQSPELLSWSVDSILLIVGAFENAECAPERMLLNFQLSPTARRRLAAGLGCATQGAEVPNRLNMYPFLETLRLAHPVELRLLAEDCEGIERTLPADDAKGARTPARGCVVAQDGAAFLAGIIRAACLGVYNRDYSIADDAKAVARLLGENGAYDTAVRINARRLVADARTSRLFFDVPTDVGNLIYFNQAAEYQQNGAAVPGGGGGTVIARHPPLAGALAPSHATPDHVVATRLETLVAAFRARPTGDVRGAASPWTEQGLAGLASTVAGFHGGTYDDIILRIRQESAAARAPAAQVASEFVAQPQALRTLLASDAPDADKLDAAVRTRHGQIAYVLVGHKPPSADCIYPALLRLRPLIVKRLAAAVRGDGLSAPGWPG